MTPQQRAAEADRVSVAFQAALAQLGLVTVQDALRVWSGLPPTATAVQASRWLREAVSLVMRRRGQARALAVAYYRLVRALRTGHTVADPFRKNPRSVTLSDLREEFRSLVGQSAQKLLEGGGQTSPPDPTSEPGTGGSDELSAGDDAFREDGIPVEVDKQARDDELRLERLARDEARIDLEALGTKNLDKKNRAIDTDAPAKDVDAAREQAHRDAGNRQAATAERIAMDGARGTIWSYAQRDKRVIGYIRLSRTGTPCGWCAMLIGRGPVYKTEKSAEYSDGDKYHDNCHCYAEPVYSREQWRTSGRYDLNRRYQTLWPKVTKGLSGKAAVSAWRKYIREEQKQSQLAREASANAQEASNA